MQGAILGLPESFTGATLKFWRRMSRYPCGNGVQLMGLGDWHTEPHARAAVMTALRRAQTIVANAKENIKLHRPEHSWLHDSGRVNYVSATDTEALEAFQLCSRMEGIIPALEPSHALAYVSKVAGDLPKDHLICMNMCGRGDKDIFTVAEALEVKI